MFLNDGKVAETEVLRSESIHAMTANQIGKLHVQRHPGADPAWSKSFPIGAGKDKFGFGFQICNHGMEGFRTIGSYSWAGIYNTHFWVDPHDGIAVVVLMQLLPFYDQNCIGVLRGVEERVYQALQ